MVCLYKYVCMYVCMYVQMILYALPAELRDDTRAKCGHFPFTVETIGAMRFTILYYSLNYLKLFLIEINSITVQ